jgi:VanZ family protein
MSRKMIIKEAGNMQFVVRKAAHMAEYACLAGLVLFGLSVNLEKKKYLYPLSLGAAALYASTDEIHQLFTPGRSGEVRDVIIDTCGALIGLLVIRFVVSLRNRRQARGVDLT